MNSRILLILLLIVSSCATKKPPATAKFLEASITHESIAVLPFIIRGKNLRSADNEHAAKLVDAIYHGRGEKLDGEYIQRKTFMTLAKKVKNGKLELIIQSFVDTNNRIREAKIPHSTLPFIDKANLANQLGVDAVIYGESIVEEGNFANDDFGGIQTHLWLYDARSREVVWEEEVEQKFNTVRENPERAVMITIDALMKKIPY